MKYFICFTLGFLFSHGLFAQTPSHTAPTLQVGLDGLSFGKGSLDSELILEIIAEKQGEIKLRVAQNILLTPLNKTGATIYSYGDNILKAVIEEKDPVIRKRRILESTVNTLFTVAFTEYFLKKVNLTSSPSSVPDDLKTLSNYILSEGKNDSTSSSNALFNQNTNTVKFENAETFNKKTDQLIFYSTILDIAAEAIQKSKKLNELGILNVSYSKTFDYQSNYLNLWKDVNDLGSEENETIIKYMNNIYDAMESELNVLIEVIGVTKFILDESNFRTLAKGINASFYESVDNSLGIQSIKVKITEITSHPNLNQKQANQINSIVNYLEKIQKRAELDILSKTQYSEIIYTISNDFIPALESLGISSPEIVESLSNLRVLARDFTSKILENSDLKNTINFLLEDQNMDFFTKLYSRLYDFDKGNTYVEYFVLISEISNFLEQSPEFSNSEVKEKLAYFNTFVKDYVVINETEKGQEYIDFKVESFLTKLSEMPTRSPKNISFLFDVGASSGWFLNESLPIEGQDPITNLSFVGEKIGIKWKIWNPGFWMTRSPGETYSLRRIYNPMSWFFPKNYIKTSPPEEPIINNMFLSFYGSGLLYNLFDVSTESEFDSIFLGGALGLGFFNNLDASVSYAVPQISNQSFGDSFKYGLLSLNFDFRFNEYIEKVGEKRKDAQNKKALAKASEAN